MKCLPLAQHGAPLPPKGWSRREKEGERPGGRRSAPVTATLEFLAMSQITQETIKKLSETIIFLNFILFMVSCDTLGHKSDLRGTFDYFPAKLIDLLKSNHGSNSQVI